MWRRDRAGAEGREPLAALGDGAGLVGARYLIQVRVPGSFPRKGPVFLCSRRHERCKGRSIGFADEVAAGPLVRELCGSDTAYLPEAMTIRAVASLRNIWLICGRDKDRNFE